MVSKIYDKLKKYIKENHNFFLFLILLIIILNIKLPYVISAPGGTLSLNGKILIDDKKVKSNYYTTYVKVMDANVASFIVGKIMPKWDVEKVSEFTGSDNLDYDDINNYEVLLMKQSNNIATMLALKEANIPYETKNNKLYVLYKYDDFENKLNIGDQIIKCNNTNVSNADDLLDCISSEDSDNVDLLIKRKNKEKNINVPLYLSKGKMVIGINVIEDFNVISDPKIEVLYDKNESGSSGGLMTALSIYDSVSNLNISKKHKIAGTGTIDEEGNVGEIAGIKYKLLGANKSDVDVFFCPDENYKEAIKVKKKYNLKLNIVKVSTFSDAINYLNKLK